MWIAATCRRFGALSCQRIPQVQVEKVLILGVISAILKVE